MCVFRTEADHESMFHYAESVSVMVNSKESEKMGLVTSCTSPTRCSRFYLMVLSGVLFPGLPELPSVS